MTTTDSSWYSARVGSQAHRIVARALAAGLSTDRAQRALELTRHARSVFEEHPISYRTREAFLDAVTAAGVYLHRFRPLEPWCLIGSEAPVGTVRFDVVHELDRLGVLVDEIKLGVGRASEAAVRKQIESYLEHGLLEWGDQFIGVRLCAVHEPLQSRLYLPKRTRSVLFAESDTAKHLVMR